MVTGFFTPWVECPGRESDHSRRGWECMELFLHTSSYLLPCRIKKLTPIQKRCPKARLTCTGIN
jgi:hypothetical protein